MKNLNCTPVISTAIHVTIAYCNQTWGDECTNVRQKETYKDKRLPGAVKSPHSRVVTACYFCYRFVSKRCQVTAKSQDAIKREAMHKRNLMLLKKIIIQKRMNKATTEGLSISFTDHFILFASQFTSEQFLCKDLKAPTLPTGNCTTTLLSTEGFKTLRIRLSTNFWFLLHRNM